MLIDSQSSIDNICTHDAGSHTADTAIRTIIVRVRTHVVVLDEDLVVLRRCCSAMAINQLPSAAVADRIANTRGAPAFTLKRSSL